MSMIGFHCSRQQISAANNECAKGKRSVERVTTAKTSRGKQVSCAKRTTADLTDIDDDDEQPVAAKRKVEFTSPPSPLSTTPAGTKLDSVLADKIAHEMGKLKVIALS